MSQYGWVIDTDHLYAADAGDHLEDEAGVMGPSTITSTMQKRLNRGEGLRFRMYDDDRELYYSGRYIGPVMDVEHLDETAFGPLNDFGEPNAGAVEIRYRNPKTGKWSTF